MIEFQHQEYPDHFVSLPASRQEWKMKSRIVNFSRTLQLSHAKLRNSKFDENQTVQRDSAKFLAQVSLEFSVIGSIE